MDLTTQKVLERFNHEKILLTAGITPRRNKITLAEVWHAAQSEPRIYQVLPALLTYKPQTITRYERDIKKFPDLEKFMQSLFNEKSRTKFFQGINALDCLKAAQTYKRFLDQKRGTQKSRTLTLRLGQEDIERLQRLTHHQLHTRSVSETIRTLAREREK